MGNLGKTLSGDTETRLDFIQKMLVGILIVAVVLIITVIVVLVQVLNDDNAEKKSIYLDLVEDVQGGNGKIDSLKEDVKDFRDIYERDKQAVVPCIAAKGC